MNADRRSSMLERRKQEWDAATRNPFDVVIIGGGINGACLYHHLCEKGFRVLLLDKGDFGSGTSQASAMMIWGGLLYLRNFDLSTVLKLCMSRERMIGEMKGFVQPQVFRYVAKRNTHNASLVAAALYFYWMLSGFRRLRPHFDASFPERAFLEQKKFQNALDYEEGRVLSSDARFVLRWILSHRSDYQISWNHCGVLSGDYDLVAKEWNLRIRDSILRKEEAVRARLVVNAAGVWTDSINDDFGIETPYKHVFSKGVFIAIKRLPQHTTPLILDTASKDCMSLIPWGPVSLWGPTETRVMDLDEGFHVNANDVEYLLKELNNNLAEPVRADDVISLRCGVRPLAVKRSYNKDCYPLDLSRRSQIVCNSEKNWISVYGGKLTGCVPLAESITKLISEQITAMLPPSFMQEGIEEPEFVTFPDLEDQVPSPSWCMENELCWNLEDYLRRRTNISQWVSRGGLGNQDQNLSQLESICSTFSGDTGMMTEYREKIHHEFDEVLGGIKC